MYCVSLIYSNYAWSFRSALARNLKHSVTFTQIFGIRLIKLLKSRKGCHREKMDLPRNENAESPIWSLVALEKNTKRPVGGAQSTMETMIRKEAERFISRPFKLSEAKLNVLLGHFGHWPEPILYGWRSGSSVTCTKGFNSTVDEWTENGNVISWFGTPSHAHILNFSNSHCSYYVIKFIITKYVYTYIYTYIIICYLSTDLPTITRCC